MQPCLRDIWHDHILFTGDEVTGLVDFGAIDIDTPATDLARLIGFFSPPRRGVGLREERGLDEAETWHEALAAYQTIRPLTADEIQAAHALDTSGTILAGCNWLRWIYVDGRVFENQNQVIVRFRRILQRTDNTTSRLITLA